MNKTRLILGIIATVISSVLLLMFLIIMSAGVISSSIASYTIFSLIVLIFGIIAIATSGNSVDRQAFEEYKRMKQQEQAMYYRYANAKGTPIEEYTMDDRTKIMVYYDRLPPKYQRKVLDEVDRIYRQFENDLYTKR